MVKSALEQGAKIHPQYRKEFESGVAVAWHRVPWTLGCSGRWTDENRAKNYENICAIDGPHRAGGRALLASAGLAGRRDAVGAGRDQPAAQEDTYCITPSVFFAQALPVSSAYFFTYRITGLRAHFRAIDHAIGIHPHAFGGAGVGIGVTHVGIGDEVVDLAGLGAADAHAALEFGIVAITLFVRWIRNR